MALRKLVIQLNSAFMRIRLVVWNCKFGIPQAQNQGNVQ